MMKATDPFLVLYPLLPRKVYLFNLHGIILPTASCLLGSCHPTLLSHTTRQVPYGLLSPFLQLPDTILRTLRTEFTTQQTSKPHNVFHPSVL